MEHGAGENWNRYWLAKLEEEIRARNYSPETLRNYHQAVKSILLAYPGSPLLWTRDIVMAFLTELRIDHGLNPSTINLYREGITFFCKNITQNTACIEKVPRLKENKMLPSVFTQYQITRFLEAIRNPKHRLAMLLAYGCGLRVSELAQLQISDIDFERKCILIVLAKGKKSRQVMLPDNLQSLIKGYIQHFRPVKWLFETGENNRPMQRRTFQAIFTNACEKAGIPRQGGIHILRHSFATHLLESGTALQYIQELLGHNHSKTTERYLHVAQDQILLIKSPLDHIRLREPKSAFRKKGSKQKQDRSDIESILRLPNEKGIHDSRIISPINSPSVAQKYHP